GKPILYYVIENLKRNGLADLIITAGYLHEKIEEYFGNGSKFGVKIGYAVENEKMNTAGSILPLKGKVDGTFVVVMGDHITNISLKEMLAQHKKSGCIATIALLKGKIPIEYGVAEVKDGRVVEFKEKPLIENLYNVAIYAFEPGIFKYIREKEDFAKNVFPRMLKAGEKINAYIFEKEVWYDIGRVVDYERLNKELKMKEIFKG
ncbi:nucleotidyltransferase family protein, partial [Candidatus Micrarchaeota archaeon]|nr:nucleotidyltransferase family protein [Candidatus Micrarchaeota archaeon]